MQIPVLIQRHHLEMMKNETLTSEYLKSTAEKLPEHNLHSVWSSATGAGIINDSQCRVESFV